MRKINFNNILRISIVLILFLYTLSSCSSSKSVVDSDDYVSIIDNKQNRTKSEKELIKELISHIRGKQSIILKSSKNTKDKIKSNIYYFLGKIFAII